MKIKRTFLFLATTVCFLFNSCNKNDDFISSEYSSSKGSPPARVKPAINELLHKSNISFTSLSVNSLPASKLQDSGLWQPGQ